MTEILNFTSFRLPVHAILLWVLRYSILNDDGKKSQINFVFFESLSVFVLFCQVLWTFTSAFVRYCMFYNITPQLLFASTPIT